MHKFTLFTDSACDMPLTFLHENNVHTIFMHYSIDSEEFVDSMTPESSKAFFDAMLGGSQPRTSQVSVPQYIEAWSAVYEEGIPIVHITLSSGLSGTYNNGLLAVQEFKSSHPNAEIHIIDSLNASQGQGLLLLSAVRLRDAGMSAEEATLWIADNIMNIHSWFTVQDLVYLKRGGRVSSASAAIGTMLDIKPVLNVDRSGHLIPRMKIKGRKRAIKTMASMVEKNIGEKTLEFPILITQASCYDDAKKLADLIKEQTKHNDIRINDMGSIIGSHTGPGLIALFFYGIERED